MMVFREVPEVSAAIWVDHRSPAFVVDPPIYWASLSRVCFPGLEAARYARHAKSAPTYTTLMFRRIPEVSGSYRKLNLMGRDYFPP